MSRTKEKTSLTLSSENLKSIDRLGGHLSRSAYVDSVLLEHFRARARAERDDRDAEIINRNAKRLNRDAEDGLEYQAPLGDRPED
jgi:hypothetical protein